MYTEAELLPLSGLQHLVFCERQWALIHVEQQWEENRLTAEGVGLDPFVGFLHTDRPGRPSLALDLMEEFRAILADRLVLSLINPQQISARGFHTAENGAVTMASETRRVVLDAWQKRKQEEAHHAFLDEIIPLGLLSRPTRARGLKHRETIALTGNWVVAPHAGAWIETWV